MRIRLYLWLLIILQVLTLAAILMPISSKVLGVVIAGIIIFIAWDIKESNDEGNLL